MKRIMSIVLALALIGALALGWTFTSATLPEPAPYAGELPAAAPPQGMSISRIDTGHIESAAALAFRGGRFSDERRFVMAPVLVRHPRGDLLIDAGFGGDVDAHAATMPWLGRVLTDYKKGRSAAEQMRENGYPPERLAGVVITHAHWDHVSGLADLKGVPVWIDANERAFVAGDAPHSALLRSFAEVEYREYAFDGGPYLGFPASHDVYGDGSIVIVPAPGHTPGSVVVFLALPSGARYALIGDLVWQLDGIELPAERPWLPRTLIGEDTELVRAAIARVAALQRRFGNDLAILPAHDEAELEKIPQFPATAQ